jgi:hypothetical protein
VSLCIVSNNDLGNIVVLDGFGLGGRWICRGCSGSSNGDLLIGQELDGGYTGGEYDARGLLELELE